MKIQYLVKGKEIWMVFKNISERKEFEDANPDAPVIDADYWVSLSYMSGGGTMSRSLYVLNSLIDDYGNYVTPPELSHRTFLSRSWFFQDQPDFVYYKIESRRNVNSIKTEEGT